jgi:hypothetical protein
MPVRYQHQVGNQIIPLNPANLQQKPAPSSSVATTATTVSTVTTRASISVQCGTHLSLSDGLVQQPVGLATQTLPKLSVVQPMLQTAGMPVTPVPSTQQSKSTGQPSSCEKGTSPLQVQVEMCTKYCKLCPVVSLSVVKFSVFFPVWEGGGGSEINLVPVCMSLFEILNQFTNFHKNFV